VRVSAESGEFSLDLGQPNVGDGIRARANGWSFGGDVWRNFDEHIRRSIPGYADLHDLVVAEATKRLPAGSVLFDLGSATGTLSQRLARALPLASVIGIDCEPSMVRSASRGAPHNLRFECTDLCRFEFSPCEWVGSCFTLQFLPVSERAPLLARAYAALRPGGVIVLAEKVKRRDPDLETTCVAALHDFKRRQGYSDAEILAKTESIEDVLVPLFDDQNEALLDEAGFRDLTLVFRNTCFDAWIAFK
jgi:tRNA (cmo5U34)-methyltransferase